MGATEIPIFFFAGLKDAQQSKKLLLDRRTINFYPTESGEYLQNYPGRVWLFKTGDADPVSSPYEEYASNFQPTGTHTRIIAFTDYLDIEHIVYTVDDKVYTVEGNGARLIHTMVGMGREGTSDVVRHPSLFIHDQKLIILNHGDSPYVWDGVQGVVPVGVREVPNPPYVTPARPVPTGDGGFIGTTYDSFDADVWTVNMNPSGTGATHGSSVYANETRRWYPNSQPKNGLDEEQTSGSANISHISVWNVQYADCFGNKGKVSAHSLRHSNPNKNSFNYTQTIGGSDYAIVPTWATIWPLVQWYPPAEDPHIAAVYVGRSLNINQSDPTPGSTSTLFLDWSQANSAGTRYTSYVSDAALAQSTLMDMTVGPPPSSEMGCSFSNSLWLVSLNRNLVYYSDSGYFGQFRDAQTINPYSNVTALVPAGDRLFVVGETSTEVFYVVNGLAALLEQDTKNGSKHGKTFVSAGDGIIFGLWNNGFGYFNGVEHRMVKEPYWLKDLYLEKFGQYTSATVIGDYYYLSVRGDFVTASPNFLIMYNMVTDSWYIVSEQVNDICHYDGKILGVDDKPYVLFRGNTYSASRVRTVGLTPETQNLSRTVSGIRVLMEPSYFGYYYSRRRRDF